MSDEAQASKGRDRSLVVLVGPPGAGKTSVGERLAARWGVELCDTDRLVEADQGCTVSDIFVDRGEAAFRALEEAAVASALTDRPGRTGVTGVVALGGGAVLAESTRLRLRGLRVVFLDVGLTAAAERVGLGVTRPLLLGNVRATLKTMLDARRPLYAEVAAVTVETDGRSLDQVVDDVEAALAGLAPVQARGDEDAS